VNWKCVCDYSTLLSQSILMELILRKHGSRVSLFLCNFCTLSKKDLLDASYDCDL